MHKFRWRLTETYLLLIVILLSVTGVIAYQSYKAYYLKNLENNLIQEASLVASITQIDNKQHSYQQICDMVARETVSRITIIDRQGKVLGDSVYNSERMDIHKDRPEVFHALKGEVGVSQRYSNTAAMEMLYVAVPLKSSQINGVVRVSMPLTALDKVYQKILSIVFLAILIAGVVALLLSVAMANVFSRPIKDITHAVRDFSRGNLKRKITYQSDDEFGILARAFNDMGESIDRGITEITEVNNRFRIFLENTINGIVMLDVTGKITYANSLAASLLEIPQESCGRKYAEVINNFDLLDTIGEVSKKNLPIKKDITLYTLGSKIVEVHVIPIESREDVYKGVLIILHDITESRRLDQVRKDFVANVSHELKTPVAAISGFAETLLQEEAQDSENTTEFIKIIYDEAQRLSRLIQQLLELSKLEMEGNRPEEKKLDLCEIIQETVAIVKQRMLREDLSIVFNPPDHAVLLASNEDDLRQILMNLLDNASKYSPDGGQIAVDLDDAPDTVCISVRDQGMGIPEKDLPRVFERFYRVDKARSRKTGGTGLGLSIVKHLTENLGGQIAVQSELGKGSIFIVKLPRLAGDAGNPIYLARN